MTNNCTARFRDRQRLEASTEEKPWIHIVPAPGEHPGVVSIPAGYEVPGYGTIESAMEVEGTTVFTAENLNRMVERFAGDVLIDYEHFSHDQDKATEAAGWGEALRPAADGSLEMQTDWAEPAREKIRTKVYRYISPEFSGSVRYEDGSFKFYPTALTGAGLTNRPKLTALRPVSANRDKQATNMKALTLLCSLIGASATDSEDVLEQKTAALKADIATSKNRASEADRLEAENKKLQAAAIDADLERFANVIDDKESAKELLQMNREKAVKVFEGMQAKLGKTPADKGQPLFQKNRATAPDGGKIMKDDAAADEAATAKFRAIEARAAALVNERGVSFSQAFETAKAELQGS